MPRKDNWFFLKKIVLILIGQGGRQLIRLISNLILTRLLVPEMFGVMAILNTIILGLNLVTDVGLRGSIINTKDIWSNKFLETIWTAQIIRGIIIYLALIVMAIPAENFFEIENLSIILAVLGTTVIISSFNSVKFLIYQRKMKIKEIVSIEIVARLFGALTMVSIAFAYKSVWALVSGSIVSSLLILFASHYFLSGPKVGLGWSAESFSGIFNFGKWVFISTIGTYLTVHADKIIFAKFISLSELGVLSIAAGLALIVTGVFSGISARILLPLFSERARDGVNDMQEIFRLRMKLISGAFVLIFIINIFGEQIVNILYDDRYASAAWMLKILSLGGMLQILDMTLRPMLLANQDSFSAMKVQIVKSVIFLFGIMFGLHYFGIIGGLLAVAVLQISGQSVLLRYTKIYGYKWKYTEYLIIGIIISSFFLSWYVQDGITWNNILGLWKK